MQSHLPRCIFLLALLLHACAANGAEVTIADAQADFEAGQYRSCLQKIARALSRPGAKPGSPQRYDLLMLRGECMLRLKEANLAADAFDSAARSVKGQGDLKRQAAAAANAALIRRSPGLRYKPTADAQAEAIDIVPADSRARAMAALLDERLTALKPELDQAMRGTSIIPMQKLLPDMAEAYALERAATGDATRTLALARALGERARELVHAELARLGARIDELLDLANEPTIVGRSNSISYRGLTSPERDELKAIGQTLLQIERVAQEGRRINRRLGGTGEQWDSILADCAERKRHAQEAYDRRY